MAERREKSREDVQRQLTRIAKEVGERGRGSLFNRLTRKNTKTIEELLEDEPIYHERKEDAPTSIALDEGVAGMLPEEFFSDPTGWIEAREARNENRADLAIKHLFQHPDAFHNYDLERIKSFSLEKDGKTTDIISKRLNPKRSDFQEIENHLAAQEKGVPVPKILGTILHAGNLYAWYERIEAINLKELDEAFGPRGFSMGIFENADARSFFSKMMKLTSPDIQERFGSLPEEMEDVSDALKLLQEKKRAFADRGEDLRRSFQESIQKDDFFAWWQSVGDVFLKELEGDLTPEELEKILRSGVALGDFVDDMISTLIADNRNMVIVDSRLSHEAKAQVMDFLYDRQGAVSRRLRGVGDRYAVARDALVADILGVTQESGQGLWSTFAFMDKVDDDLRAKGVVHPDLHPGNIIIDWDFEAGVPKQADGKVGWHVIDWEAHEVQNEEK